MRHANAPPGIERTRARIPLSRPVAPRRVDGAGGSDRGVCAIGSTVRERTT